MSKPVNGFKRSAWWISAAVVLLSLCAIAWGGSFRISPQKTQAGIVTMAFAPSTAGYSRVTRSPELVFPRDHGPHPEFLTEWWYYTGNLVGEDGSRYGFQLTFFRRSLSPPSQAKPRQSAWTANDIYMAHFTFSDVPNSKFHYFERFERGSAGLAGATGEPEYRVWLHDWEVQQISSDQYHLRVGEGEIALDLVLTDRKGIVLQGEQGYSQKGPDAGNASIYYSQPRLETSGRLIINGQTVSVSGESWMDREISTSALSKGQIGWDWFALQLEDGTELMVYILRGADGSVDAYSRGSYILQNGQTIPLSREDIQIKAGKFWKSPRSSGVYPADWQISIPSLNLDLMVTPQIADQELNVSFIYWEGSVTVNGSRDGRQVRGFGYVELTGYSRSLEGGF